MGDNSVDVGLHWDAIMLQDYWFMLLLVVKCMCESLFLCLQNELDYCGEEPSMSPRAPLQHQPSQPVMHVTNSGFPLTSGQTMVGQGL